MASRLQSSELLPLQGHPILDLGIAPQDVKRMRGQRALKPQRSQYAMPLDHILFATLSGWVAYGMLENMAFADFLLQHQSGAIGADSGASIGFG